MRLGRWWSLLALLAAPLPAAAPASANADPDLRDALVRALASTDGFENRYAAEVWLLDMSQRLQHRLPDPAFRLDLLRQVHAEARRAGLQPELVLAVIEVESGFNRWAISAAGARGLMQVMPFWVEELEEELGFQDKNVLFRIDTNVLMGCRILKYYLEMERFDLVRGLARYNGSVGQTWYADRVVQRLNRKWYRF